MAGLQDMAAQQAMAQQGAPSPEEEAMLAEEGAPPEEPLDPGEELDSDIGFGLLASLIYENETTDILEDALNKPNPVPAIAQLLASAVDKIAQKSEERGTPLSPRIWLSKGGAVDRAIDEIAEMAEKLKINFPNQAQSAVFGEVIDALKLAGQAEKRGQQGGAGMGAPPMGAAPVGAPMAPAGAVPSSGPPPMEGAPMPMMGGNQ